MPNPAKAAGVGATEMDRRPYRSWMAAWPGISLCSGALAWLVVLAWASMVRAEVLTEDRSEGMYHRYDGGGVTVQGPALLVRKDFKNKLSTSLVYYRDSISAASPDIYIAGASPYEDTRNEIGVSAEYLYENALLNAAYIYSDESDYRANTLSFGSSYEVFGGLTKFSMGFSRGWDKVLENGNPLFDENADHYNYTLGWNQVLTKDLVFDLDYEGIADKGYLHSPYRKALLQGVAVDEQYPSTRTSNAVSLSAIKYWDYGASSYIKYRFYTDSWDITGHTAEIGYSQYFGSKWLADLYVRHYKQNGASFYANNFETEQNYMARDKELSDFTSNTIGAKVSYKLFDRYKILDAATLNLAYDLLRFDYDGYTKRNPATDAGQGNYSFNAYTLQAFFAVKY